MVNIIYSIIISCLKEFVIKYNEFLVIFDLENQESLLQLLLGAYVVGMATLLLTTVGSPGVQPGITLTTNHFVTVVLLG